MDVIEIRKILINRCRLVPDKPVIIGVSGGPDSLCLLNLMHQLGYQVIAAHFDHQLRPDSGSETWLVSQMASECGAPFVTGTEDIRRLAELNHQSIEEAARQARYRWLFSQATQAKAQAVAVAHNADDQVETVLMHLLRGTGIGGLRGMEFWSESVEWSSTIPLVRPLLSTWRHEIEEYCSQHHLSPLRDPTNQETTYYRNRLRLELIPFLKQFNPKVNEVIWRMSQTLAADYEALNQFFDPVWASCCTFQNDQYIKFSLPNLRALSAGMQRMVLRHAVSVLHPGLRDFDFAAVERARQFLDQPSATAQIDLGANFRIFLECEDLFIAKWGARVIDASWPQLTPGQTIQLEIPGKSSLEGGFIITSELLPAGEIPQPLEITDNQAYLDADLIEIPMIIRTRRFGDRFCPLGMQGHSLKLSDFFINRHHPARARDGWPLICSGDTIIWVAGLRPSHQFMISSKTRKVLHLSLLKSIDSS